MRNKHTQYTWKITHWINSTILTASHCLCICVCVWVGFKMWCSQSVCVCVYQDAELALHFTPAWPTQAHFLRCVLVAGVSKEALCTITTVPCSFPACLSSQIYYDNFSISLLHFLLSFLSLLPFLPLLSFPPFLPFPPFPFLSFLSFPPFLPFPSSFKCLSSYLILTTYSSCYCSFLCYYYVLPLVNRGTISWVVRKPW